MKSYYYYNEEGEYIGFGYEWDNESLYFECCEVFYKNALVERKYA